MPKHKPSQQLRAARKLLTARSRWTKGYYARNLQGEITEPNSRDAVCFCSLGAMRKVSGSQHSLALSFLYKAVEKIDGPCATVASYNDNDKTAHADVLKLFDVAIEIAEKAEKANA